MAGSELGDRILVRRMLRGEERAFDEFFEGYFPRLYRFAMARLDHDHDAAEEVVQAALCNAIAGLRTYRGEAGLFTWLCTICRREIHAFVTRQRRVPAERAPLDDSPEVRAALESLAAALGQDPETETQRREIARLVQVTLDSLPPWYGDALEWKYIQGLSVNEIASRLSLGLKAAESLLTRARQAFRDGFASLAGHEGRARNPAR